MSEALRKREQDCCWFNNFASIKLTASLQIDQIKKPSHVIGLHRRLLNELSIAAGAEISTRLDCSQSLRWFYSEIEVRNM